MTEPTITIACGVGALVVGDHPPLLFGDNVLPLTDADDIIGNGAFAFASGLLECVDGSTVVMHPAPDVDAMSVRDVRDGVSKGHWNRETMRTMLDAERGGKARKGIIKRLRDAIGDDRPSGPVAVDVG